MGYNDQNTIIEVYALLDHSNETYSSLNQVLVHFRCSIIKMRLDEFERNFRDYFGLRAFTSQEQNTSISIKDQTVPITQELFDILQSGSFEESQFLKPGYVMLLKKSFVLFEDTTKSCLKKINGFRNMMDDFIASLNRCMCVAGYKYFHITHSFIHIPALRKTVVRKNMNKFQPVYSPISFLNKDRYFIKLYLQFEEKQQKHVKKAVLLFCNAVSSKDKRSKFLQLIAALATCFQSDKSNYIAPQQYARYVFVLCNEYRSSYENLCQEFVSLLKWKQLMDEGLDSDELNGPEFINQLTWIENILNEMIRKMIRLNHFNQESLIENLEKRFFVMAKAYR